MNVDAKPLARLSLPANARQGLPQAAFYMAIALCTLAGHFMLGAAFGGVGFIWIAVVAAASFFTGWELAFALLMACLLLQNAFIAAVIPLIDDSTHFSILLGTGFAVTALLALIYGPAWLKMRRELPAESETLLRWMTYFFIVVLGYTALGTMSVSLTSTLVYARIYFTGALMLIIGVALGFRLSFGYVLGVIRILAVMLTLWAVCEYCFTYGLYDVFHIVEFFNLKYTSLSNTLAFASIDEVIEAGTNSYLNLSGQFGLDIELLRLMGPNLHPISYAYALAFCGLLCFIDKRPILTWLCVVLILLIGAKGPLLKTLLSIALALFYGRTRNPRWVLMALGSFLGIFVITGVIYGIASEDYHVVGLLGGLHGFMENPLGHGVGSGGNMSSAGMTANFQLFQGYGADFALESGIGVMLYQIGIGAIAFFILYWKIWKSVWDATFFFATQPRLIVVPVVLAFLIFNGIFQEEVFSPVGWGLWLLFSGMILAWRWQGERGKLPLTI